MIWVSGASTVRHIKRMWDVLTWSPRLCRSPRCCWWLWSSPRCCCRPAGSPPPLSDSPPPSHRLTAPEQHSSTMITLSSWLFGRDIPISSRVTSDLYLLTHRSQSSHVFRPCKTYLLFKDDYLNVPTINFDRDIPRQSTGWGSAKEDFFSFKPSSVS